MLRERVKEDPVADLPIGRALVDAVARVRRGEEPQAQTVAFAVAGAVRDGDEHAPEALTDLVAVVAGRPALGDGTLTNLLTAMQFASMAPATIAVPWAPSQGPVAEVLRRGLGGSDDRREQTEGLLWAMAGRGVVVSWLGSELASVADLVTSPDLRDALRP